MGNGGKGYSLISRNRVRFNMPSQGGGKKKPAWKRNAKCQKMGEYTKKQWFGKKRKVAGQVVILNNQKGVSGSKGKSSILRQVYDIKKITFLSVQNLPQAKNMKRCPG